MTLTCNSSTVMELGEGALYCLVIPPVLLRAALLEFTLLLHALM